MDDAMEDPLRSASISSLDGTAHDGANEDALSHEERERILTHRPRGFAKLTPAAVKTATHRGPSNRGAIAGSAPRPAPTPQSVPAPARDLGTFADQLVAIAEQLRSGNWQTTPTRENDRPAPVCAAAPQSALTPPGSVRGEERRQAFAEMARLSYAKRRKRATVFGDTELFGEPAWDILLDLYIAQAEQKPVSVSSACIGSAAPPTTGLRWLGVLAEQDLVERQHDPQDQRRVLVRLTEKALEAMDCYFECSAALQNDRRAARA